MRHLAVAAFLLGLPLPALANDGFGGLSAAPGCALFLGCELW